VLPEIFKIKGIHPGAVLKRALKQSAIQKKELARRINEYPQTISAIINERRGINPALSIKLADFFKIDPAYFMILQAYYEVELARRASEKEKTPDLKKFRKILFWDTNMDKLNWETQKEAIIKRVFQRGNSEEFSEILNFYGMQKVQSVLKPFLSEYPAFKESLNFKMIKNEMV